MEACHKFGKSDLRHNIKETIVRFVNMENFKFALLNKKKSGNIDNEKFQFSNSTKIFVNKNSTPIVKRIVLIQAPYT